MLYDLLHTLKTRGLHLCLQGDRLSVGPTDRLDGLRDRIGANSEALKTLVAGLGGQASAGAVLEHYLSAHTVVTEPWVLIDAVQRLRQAPVVAVDLETTGLDSRTDRTRLIALASPTETCLIDTTAFTPDSLRRCLEPLFSEGPRLVFHHAMFDLEFLAHLGLEPSSGHLYDTAIAEQLIRHSGRMPALTDLVERYLGFPLDKSLQKSDWSQDLTPEQLRYAALDARSTLLVYLKQSPILHELGLERVAGIEFRSAPAVVWMRRAGVPFDPERWVSVAKTEEAQAAEALRELDPSVNWASPKQVLETLRRIGLDLPDTSFESLSRYREQPVVAALLRYREHSKRLGTYGATWLQHLHPETGRIHPGWRLIGADTGRMACSSPNLMQVPREPLYRACFRAPEGRVLVKADYSQIELRLAALIAEEQAMLEAFAEGQDLHTKTALAVTGKPLGAISKQDRQLAKALNFGLLYGMGAESLRSYALANYGVTLTPNEAAELRERFFRAYPGLRRWHRSQPEGETEVRTLTGRLRVTDRYTEKLNTPVQGSGADILKLALALLYERRHRLPGVHPVLAVHDELVLEAPAHLASLAQVHLEQAMLEAAQSVTGGRVTIAVESGVFLDWGVEPAPAPTPTWLEGLERPERFPVEVVLEYPTGEAYAIRCDNPLEYLDTVCKLHQLEDPPVRVFLEVSTDYARQA